MGIEPMTANIFAINTSAALSYAIYVLQLHDAITHLREMD